MIHPDRERTLSAYRSDGMRLPVQRIRVPTGFFTDRYSCGFERLRIRSRDAHLILCLGSRDTIATNHAPSQENGVQADVPAVHLHVHVLPDHVRSVRQLLDAPDL